MCCTQGILRLLDGRELRGVLGLGVLLAVLLAPLAATLIQLAISRTREFDADEDGSRLE